MKNIVSILLVFSGSVPLLLEWEDKPPILNIVAAFSIVGGICLFILDKIEGKRSAKKIEKRFSKIELDLAQFQGNLNDSEYLKPIFNNVIIKQKKYNYSGAIEKLKTIDQTKLSLTNKIAINFNIARNYQILNNPNEAGKFYEKAILAANNITNVKEKNKILSRVYHNLGTLEKSYGNTSKALNLINNAEELSQEDDFEGRAMIYGCKGDLLLTKGKTSKALEYQNKAILYYEKAENKWGLSNSLINIANIYRDTARPELALEKYDKALNISLQNNFLELIADSYLGIGVILKNKQKYTKSRKQINSALEYYKILNESKGEAYCLANLGHTYFLETKVKKASKYHKKALTIFKKNNDKRGIANELANIGNIESNLGNHSEAISLIETALKLHTEIAYNFGIASDLKLLGAAFLEKKEIKIAIENFEKSINLFKKMNNQLEVTYLQNYVNSLN